MAETAQTALFLRKFAIASWLDWVVDQRRSAVSNAAKWSVAVDMYGIWDIELTLGKRRVKMRRKRE